jgi:hypothetical protein
MMDSNMEVRSRGVEDEEAGFRTRLMFRRVKRRYGHVPLSTRIRARDPKLLALSERMSRYTAAPGVVSPKLKELAQLKVAVMVGCPF